MTDRYAPVTVTVWSDDLIAYAEVTARLEQLDREACESDGLMVRSARTNEALDLYTQRAHIAESIALSAANAWTRTNTPPVTGDAVTF